MNATKTAAKTAAKTSAKKAAKTAVKAAAKTPAKKAVKPAAKTAAKTAARRPRSAAGARRVMVTGATGFVGAHSVKALLDAGHEVKLLVRSKEKAQEVLGALGVKKLPPIVIGDMTDEAAVLEALDGCDAALHCAAFVSTQAKDAERMRRDNPQGTRIVVGNAVRLGLDPVVYVSSVAALMKPGLPVLHPDLPVADSTTSYGQSKAEAERYVRSLQDQDKPVVITYPGSVIGPAAGSVRGEAASGIATQVRAGSMPTREAAWSVIDARDLGALHTAAMVRGRGPRRYMCGGHYLDMDALAALYGALLGKSFEVKKMPGWALRAMGWVVDKAPNLKPPELDLSYESMVFFTQQPPSDDSRVVDELGIRWRAAEESLRDAILALVKAGQLEPGQVGRLAGA
ncbi:MAG TPA: NAD-dependent epimerase/dehydratase family protein [Rubrivivax sp.]|nr:NAD-dependent epimerase/dehydratase family protein [Rubrivivax sp.]